MTPETWADVANWMLLAVGAAMAGGTGLALLRYRRDGVWPGQVVPDDHGDDEGRPVRAASVRSAYAKVVVGAALALYGVAGLTAGTLIGW